MNEAIGPRRTRRDFLRTAGATGMASHSLVTAAGIAPPLLNPAELARRNSIVRRSLSPDFFEGMLLGNGDLGIVVVMRPDALGLHIGKADCWDIRVSEDHYQHVLPFDQLLELWKEASEAAKREGDPGRLNLERNYPPFAEYTRKTRSSYARPWPRPWPCGTVWIHWDPRTVHLVTQKLDIADGLFTASLEIVEQQRRMLDLHCFASWDTGHLAVFTDSPAPFTSIAYYPHIDEATQMPLPDLDVRAEGNAVIFSCFQRLPALAPTDQLPKPPASSDDCSFALAGSVQGEWREEAAQPDSIAAASDKRRRSILLRGASKESLRLDLAIATPRDEKQNVRHAADTLRAFAATPMKQLRERSREGWHRYWSRSAAEFQDRELERIWYYSQYLLACCLKAGKIAPGIFGNWSYGQIGTAWHADYHMNYNTQQLFWGLFSSNRVEQHLPYVDLVEALMPIAEREAREKFKLPGAYFPHSAYPVPSKVNAYPVPPWGYEICETPWTVQSLWWHYLYTLDQDYLRRVYPLLRAATLFIVNYARKGADGKYHIQPTVSPENWGFTVDFRLNRDCIIDLALSEFLLDAMLRASEILGLDANERSRWKEVRENLAPYPKAAGPRGEVWLDVLDAPTEYVYNFPVTLAPVFPGEQVGLGKREDLLEIARRTAATVRLEGATDLVAQPMVRARLGMLNFAWFKEEIRYCLLPNGVAGDRVRQIGGRYRDTTNYDYLMCMGIWVENFALPAVLNECMLQSYTGTLRLFPNAAGLGPARFENLRAAGAFLVGAAWNGQSVTSLTVHSEKGSELRLVNPWKSDNIEVRDLQNLSAIRRLKSEARLLRIATQAGKSYSLAPIPRPG